MNPTPKQRSAIEEAVGEFGLACDRAARLHREEAEALTRWRDSRIDIAGALLDGKVDVSTTLKHYADARDLVRAETARAEATAIAKSRHGDILDACLLLTVPE